MTNRKQSTRTRMARIVALATAGVLLFSIILAYMLR